MVTIYDLLKYLKMYGGSIISSNVLHPLLIDQAKASNHMYIDEDGFGFIWEPPIAGRFPETDRCFFGIAPNVL